MENITILRSDRRGSPWRLGRLDRARRPRVEGIPALFVLLPGSTLRRSSAYFPGAGGGLPDVRVLGGPAGLRSGERENRGRLRRFSFGKRSEPFAPTVRGFARTRRPRGKALGETSPQAPRTRRERVAGLRIPVQSLLRRTAAEVFLWKTLQFSAPTAGARPGASDVWIAHAAPK